MKYDDIVQTVCGKGWKSVSYEEKEGGYGVAMVLAFLEGVSPDLSSFSNHLGVMSSDLVSPFSRLANNGVFAPKTAEDTELTGSGFSSTSDYVKKYWTKEKAFTHAWCNIAAVASGIVYYG